ncbi:MAG: metallophosphoesterase, partial [Candidatus Poribacteria bacterium]|nr:metallophosphoesterase [Candidatus Poribacteria bacterium]
MQVTHTLTDEMTTICIEGLHRTVRMLHITDLHLALIDDRDADHIPACADACQRFEPSVAISDRMMMEAKTLDLDLIALTGDIVHFPSHAAVEGIKAAMAQVNVPVLYTAGNHDWHFPGLSGREELREAWWPALQPLHRGHASHARHEI